MSKKKVFYVVIVLLLSCLVGALHGSWRVYQEISLMKEEKKQQEQRMRQENERWEKAQREAKERRGREERQQQEMEKMEGVVQQLIARFGDGEWAVYVKDLTRGGSFEINSHSMESASLIKLYIMGAVWQAVEDKALVMTPEIQELLTQMITVSDNESSNRLVEALSPSGLSHPEGRTVVNGFAAANGFSETSQGRDLKDHRDVEPVEKNYTSVRDCGLFLEKVYRAQCVSPEASGHMLELLKGQQRREKIPGGLPEGVVTANKTGEVSTMEHDVAIVYGPGRDYVLCVMSVGLVDTQAARQHIREISAAVYEEFRRLE
ncbi:MAG: serine hydrolase [Lachnospiraceae bacterium]|nr:serine hydrolase [Lachnospiraceae bacterium]